MYQINPVIKLKIFPSYLYKFLFVNTFKMMHFFLYHFVFSTFVVLVDYNNVIELNKLCLLASPNEERRFFAFHDWGISVYEPSTCRLYHQIQSTDIIPGTQVIGFSQLNKIKNISIKHPSDCTSKPTLNSLPNFKLSSKL